MPSKPVIPEEIILQKIYLIRNKKVMLDRDLALLYGVETKSLKRAVRRNISRFPADFMFELTKDELQNWRRQFGTSNAEKMGLRYPPLAFTEQGVAMLSSVLNSERAIQVNIQIIRIFTKLREILQSHKELREKIEAMEQKYDKKFQIIFTAIKKLLDPEIPSKKEIGFKMK